MLKYKFTFLLTLFFAFAFGLFSQNNFRIIAYLSENNWSMIPQLNLDNVTHVNLSFAKSDVNGNLSFGKDMTSFVSSAHAKNVKVFIALGGGSLTNADSLIYANGFNPP